MIDALLQLYATSETHLDRDLNAWDIIRCHVTFMSAMLSMGHSKLLYKHALHNGAAHPDHSTSPQYRHLMEAAQLLREINHYAEIDSVGHVPKPWQQGSPFLRHRQNLDSLNIVMPGELFLDVTELGIDFATNGRVSNALHAALLWNCSVILLNRNFLPPTTIHEGDGPSKHPLPLGYLPDCPRPFLKERIFACDASADRICHLCSIIIDRRILILVRKIKHMHTIY